ncbi:hypothetical protein EWB00_002603 [Schistosoma japonicum]|uniref:Uncharacterized protein n=1 Tax=Schistosoma japonicum TaxID=6182 RepID=A0A4Z2DBI1_SCHJA|nr:hypothetical protein EWB00_002603 [Schistosoma japonicum]
MFNTLLSSFPTTYYVSNSFRSAIISPGDAHLARSSIPTIVEMAKNCLATVDDELQSYETCQCVFVIEAISVDVEKHCDV